MNQQQNNNRGFTLIEAVVATAVFAFFISAILGVYVSTLRLDSRTRALRAVTDNSRFIMDFLAKEVRNGHIDYTAQACGGVASGTNDLCLVNQGNEAEHIFVETPGLLGGNGTNLMIAKAIGTSSLNSSSVRVTKFAFYIFPMVDPLTPLKAANEQPHVTMVMQLKANSSRDPVTISVESTFSENYYPSRQ